MIIIITSNNINGNNMLVEFLQKCVGSKQMLRIWPLMRAKTHVSINLNRLHHPMEWLPLQLGECRNVLLFHRQHTHTHTDSPLAAAVAAAAQHKQAGGCCCCCCGSQQTIGNTTQSARESRGNFLCLVSRLVVKAKVSSTAMAMAMEAAAAVATCALVCGIHPSNY